MLLTTFTCAVMPGYPISHICFLPKTVNLLIDGMMATLQEDDPNAAAAALEANFPDTVKKNKRRKAGSSAAVIPALAEAGRGSAQHILQGTLSVQRC